MKNKIYFYKYNLVDSLGGGKIQPHCIQSTSVSTGDGEWYVGWSTYIVPEQDGIEPLTVEEVIDMFNDNIMAVGCFRGHEQALDDALQREDDIVYAKARLSATGWYVERFIETGKEIPEDIKAQRAEWRKQASRN